MLFVVDADLCVSDDWVCDTEVSCLNPQNYSNCNFEFLFSASMDDISSTYCSQNM